MEREKRGVRGKEREEREERGNRHPEVETTRDIMNELVTWYTIWLRTRYLRTMDLLTRQLRYYSLVAGVGI